VKSAYEIAMKKAEKLDQEGKISENERMEMREELKPLLARFYKEKIDSEELWQELKEKGDNQLLAEAQAMLSESLGLRTLPEEFDRRKEGILALETLKQKQNSSVIEQILNKISSLQQKYKRKRENITEKFKKQKEQNSQMQMKPVQTKDGKTVMKMQSSVGEETRERVNKAISQLEERSDKMFTDLIEKLKEAIS
jgi:hypothetical protein